MANKIYPWDTWFNQTRTELVKGVDYEVTTAVMWQTIKNNASSRGVKISIVDLGGDRLVLWVAVRPVYINTVRHPDDPEQVEAVRRIIHSTEIYPYGEYFTSCGIYALYNVIDGRMYIGFAPKEFQIRKKYHERNLKNRKHPVKELQQAWNMYGPSAFEFRILDVQDTMRDPSDTDMHLSENHFKILLGWVYHGKRLYNAEPGRRRKIPIVYNQLPSAPE